MKTILQSIFCLLIFSFKFYAQKVGVNTTAPSDALHIVGAAADNPLRIQVGTATKLRVLNNGGTTIGLNNTAGTPANGLYVDGNTGLGVSNPTDKLAVGGNINVIGEIKVNGIAGQSGQILQANGNGTMDWVNKNHYKNYQIFIIAGNNTWRVPEGVTEIMVELVGGGGGGDIRSGGSGGGYVNFIRTVTPNEILSFFIGSGGLGKNIGSATQQSVAGQNTTFPIGVSANECIASGGGPGQGGQGGNFTIEPGTLASIGRRGESGKLGDITYYQIASNTFAQKTIYGNGGNSGYGYHPVAGNGGITIINTSTNTNILNYNPGNGQLGAGGGGGGGLTLLPLPTSTGSGGNGGPGFVIIHWN